MATKKNRNTTVSVQKPFSFEFDDLSITTIDCLRFDDIEAQLSSSIDQLRNSSDFVFRIMTSKYVKNLAEAIKIVADSGASRVRYLSYGTVIFVPEVKHDSLAGDSSIDYGTAVATNKKNRCPRVLLMSTWADAKFGFVGLREGVNVVNSA